MLRFVTHADQIQNVQFQVKKSCPDLLLLAFGFVVLRETAPLVFQQVSFHLQNISANRHQSYLCFILLVLPRISDRARSHRHQKMGF